MKEKKEDTRVICYGCGNRDFSTFYWEASNLWCMKCGEIGIEPFMKKDWKEYNKKFPLKKHNKKS